MTADYHYEISYGKARVPLYRVYAAPLSGVTRIPESSFTGRDNMLFAMEIDVEVFGNNFLPAYISGDNANVVATDSMKTCNFWGPTRRWKGCGLQEGNCLSRRHACHRLAALPLAKVMCYSAGHTMTLLLQPWILHAMAPALSSWHTAAAALGCNC